MASARLGKCISQPYLPEFRQRRHLGKPFHL
jgi:hypothetical protein